jgi:hypothetical protein
MAYSVEGIEPSLMGNAAVDDFIALCDIEPNEFDDRYEEHLDNRFNDEGNPDYNPDTVVPMKNKLSECQAKMKPTPLNVASQKELRDNYAVELEGNTPLKNVEKQMLKVMSSRFGEMIDAASQGYHAIDEVTNDDEARALFLPYMLQRLNEYRPIPIASNIRPHQLYASRGGDLGGLRQQMTILLDKVINLSNSGLKLDNDYVQSVIPIMWKESGIRHTPLVQSQIEWISSLARKTLGEPNNKERALALLMDAASSVCLSAGEQLYPPFDDIELIGAEKSLIALIKREGETLDTEQAKMVVSAIQVRYPLKEFTSILKQLTEITDEKKVIEAFELHWPDMDAMLSSRHGDITKYMSSPDQSEVTLNVGSDEYTFKFHDIKDSEGHSNKQRWEKNGCLHRYGGPAEDYTSKHYIPEETHMDRASISYALEGRNYDSQDLTYERITREKMPSDISNKIDRGEDLSHDDEVRLGRLQMM